MVYNVYTNMSLYPILDNLLASVGIYLFSQYHARFLSFTAMLRFRLYNAVLLCLGLLLSQTTDAVEPEQLSVYYPPITPFLRYYYDLVGIHLSPWSDRGLDENTFLQVRSACGVRQSGTSVEDSGTRSDG
jgi:hypothetical protein